MKESVFFYLLFPQHLIKTIYQQHLCLFQDLSAQLLKELAGQGYIAVRGRGRGCGSLAGGWGGGYGTGTHDKLLAHIRYAK
jgi:hypothetical protein